MQTEDQEKPVPPTLDDLIDDSRLARLFSKDTNCCGLQLWILQIKYKEAIESRIIYGRLLPYSHFSQAWSSGQKDNFRAFENIRAQLIRLNLYVQSSLCADILRLLSAGKDIAALSEELKLGLSDKLKARFGAITLAADGLVYRPVSFLLNRDAGDRRSLTSPHGSAGALSASISQIDKGALFRLGQNYEAGLTTLVVKQLNAETGMDFGEADISRFGDIELLVFPTLDDLERNLLKISWPDTRHEFIAQFNPMQVPHFSGFQFHLNIYNGGHVIHSVVSTAKRNTTGEFESKFNLSNDVHARTDSTELQIFGFEGKQLREGTLICRWQIGYIREISLQGHAVGHRVTPVQFDWLERTTRASFSERVKAALTINGRDLGFSSLIGGGRTDPWVRINRDFAALFARLHPQMSEGRFFLRWVQGDGEGRIQFIEWFRKLLSKHQHGQVVIFDPYFEDAGLGLVLICAEPNSNFIVFRSLPKPFKTSHAEQQTPDKPASDGIDDLITSCNRNREALKRVQLRIYGMKDGRLHDRYILIIGSDGLPIEGFHLSNSLQKAAENHPLLVTPIPADVLLEVERYQSDLVREAAALSSKADAKNSPMRLLFDSKASPTARPRYEPLRFPENSKAGDVLSAWTSEPSLLSLSGNTLKKQMRLLGLLKDESLVLPEAANISNFLDQRDDFADFASTWEVLGELLAHSHVGDDGSHCVELKRGFLEFLSRFLEKSFTRVHMEEAREFTVIDSRLFTKTVETLLHSSYRPEHMYYAIKYAALTWPEYFAIKLLWLHSPSALLEIAESQMGIAPVEPKPIDTMRLSLLSQIISEISLSVQFSISQSQQDYLLNSRNGLLQWSGLNALERQCETPAGLAAVLQKISALTYTEQVRALGWMVHRVDRNLQKGDIYCGLISALHGALPATLDATELKLLIDSMRGHMKTLAWVEPWLFRDVIAPLLNGRANSDDACTIWVQEIAVWLGSAAEFQPRLFERTREGQTTNIAAFLVANSTSTRRQASITSMKAILERQRRIVQQPLASTADWARWDRAVIVSMWILSFCLWTQFYLRQRGMTDTPLGELSRRARELAMVRPMDEWRATGPGSLGELGAFYDQAEQLLASIMDAAS